MLSWLARSLEEHRPASHRPPGKPWMTSWRTFPSKPSRREMPFPMSGHAALAACCSRPCGRHIGLEHTTVPRRQAQWRSHSRGSIRNRTVQSTREVSYAAAD